jgi:hypothetical protein
MTTSQRKLKLRETFDALSDAFQHPVVNLTRVERMINTIVELHRVDPSASDEPQPEQDETATCVQDSFSVFEARLKLLLELEDARDLSEETDGKIITGSGVDIVALFLCEGILIDSISTFG